MLHTGRLAVRHAAQTATLRHPSLVSSLSTPRITHPRSSGVPSATLLQPHHHALSFAVVPALSRGVSTRAWLLRDPHKGEVHEPGLHTPGVHLTPPSASEEGSSSGGRGGDGGGEHERGMLLDRCANPAYEQFLLEPLAEQQAPYRRWALLLVAVHATVFAGWYFAKQDRPDGGKATLNPVFGPKYVQMRERWSTSFKNLREGRVYTLLTSAFSHQEVLHLAMNSYVAYSFVPMIAASIGGARAAVLYTGAAITSSLAHIFYTTVLRPMVLHRAPQRALVPGPDGNTLVLGRTHDMPALGASGALMGVLAMTACLQPKAKFNIMFVPFSIQARYLVPGLIAVDLVASVVFEKSFVAHWGHIGGAVFGGLFYLLAIRGRPRANDAAAHRFRFQARHFYEGLHHRTLGHVVREAWLYDGKLQPGAVLPPGFHIPPGTSLLPGADKNPPSPSSSSPSPPSSSQPRKGAPKKPWVSKYNKITGKETSDREFSTLAAQAARAWRR